MDNNNKNDVKQKIGRNNHYVPRMYLKQWADSDNKICMYNLLVSNENVPVWNKQAVSRTASMGNLYVRMDGNWKEMILKTILPRTLRIPLLNH